MPKISAKMLPLLPNTARSWDGMEFSPASNQWQLRDATQDRTLDWEKFYASSALSLITSFKLTMTWFVINKSLSHSANIFNQLLNFMNSGTRSSTATEITKSQVISFRSTLRQADEWKLATVSGFLKKLEKLGYPGLEDDVSILLRSLRLKQNNKGVAVMTMDPVNGPFTDNELQAIDTAVSADFGVGQLTLEGLSLISLLRAFGCRMVQIASLKIKDIEKDEDSFYVQLPRAKQRNSHHRTEFKRRQVIREIGQVLILQCESVRRQYNEIGSHSLDERELPLFPNWLDKPCPKGFEFHYTSHELEWKFVQFIKPISVASERTDKPLKISPRRFRYTVGTRAAEEGYGVLLIAELLDHSDTQSAGVYVFATMKLLNNIDKALARHLAPLAQAFQGQLLHDRSKATRAMDPESAVDDPKFSGDLGRCGRYGFCNAAAPIACYTCRSFQAWDDAPHEEVLDFLLLDRQRILDATGDQRVAAVNDRTILAVARVIQLVEDRGHEPPLH